MTGPWINGPAFDPANAAITGGSIGGSTTGVALIYAQSWTAVSAPADTSEDTLATITIAAGTLRANDSLLVEVLINQTNNANNKTGRIRWGAAGAGTVMASTTLSTASGYRMVGTIINANSTTAQQVEGYALTPAGQSYTPPASASLDTGSSQTIIVSGQKTTSGDTYTMLGYRVWLIRA